MHHPSRYFKNWTSAWLFIDNMRSLTKQQVLISSETTHDKCNVQASRQYRSCRALHNRDTSPVGLQSGSRECNDLTPPVPTSESRLALGTEKDWRSGDPSAADAPDVIIWEPRRWLRVTRKFDEPRCSQWNKWQWWSHKKQVVRC